MYFFPVIHWAHLCDTAGSVISSVNHLRVTILCYLRFRLVIKRFSSRRLCHYYVTILCKLFTPLCLAPQKLWLCGREKYS